MSSTVSDRARANLARSLPLVRQNRDRIVERMERHLRGLGDQKAFGQSEVAAMMLVQLLLRQAGRLAEGRTPEAPGGLAGEHHGLGIDSRHYSRFGDSLVPILLDVLGPGTPREIPAAWCDTFWAAIHDMQASREAQEPREALPA